MKIRFATNEGVEKNIPTWLAIDTDEITSFKVDEQRSLFLWFRGTSHYLEVSQEEIGEDAFDFLLLTVCELFPNYRSASDGEINDY